MSKLSLATAGIRPLLIGIGLGGFAGSMLAIPALQHDLSGGGSEFGGALGQPTRRVSGVLANFVVPAALVILAARTTGGSPLHTALLSGAMAVTGAYWGVRLLGSE